VSVIIDGFDVSDTDDWWGWTYTGGKAARGFVEPAARADFFNEIALARMAQHGPGAVKVYPASRGRSYFYTYERPFVADTVTGRAWEGIRAAWVYSGDDPAMARVFGCCTGPAVIDPFSEPIVADPGAYDSNTAGGQPFIPSGLTNGMLLVWMWEPFPGGAGDPFNPAYTGRTVVPVTSLLEHASGGTEVTAQLFYVLDPQPGGAWTMDHGYYGHMVLGNVNQSDPIAAVVSAEGLSSTPSPGTIGGSGLYIGCVAGTGGDADAPAALSPLAEAWTVGTLHPWSSSGAMGYGASALAWTYTGSELWIAVGVAVNGA
jgi:hypothetical protein